MPARPRTAAAAARTVRVEKKPARSRPATSGAGSGTFARLKAKAAEQRPDIEPYVIDDVDPPIAIYPPEDADTQLEIAELFGSDGRFLIKDARRVLKLICGDAFDDVWELVGKEHITVLLSLIAEMGDHFQAQAAPAEDVDEEDFPGGSPASSR